MLLVDYWSLVISFLNFRIKKTFTRAHVAADVRLVAADVRLVAAEAAAEAAADVRRRPVAAVPATSFQQSTIICVVYKVVT